MGGLQLDAFRSATTHRRTEIRPQRSRVPNRPVAGGPRLFWAGLRPFWGGATGCRGRGFSPDAFRSAATHHRTETCLHRPRVPQPTVLGRASAVVAGLPLLWEGSGCCGRGFSPDAFRSATTHRHAQRRPNAADCASQPRAPNFRPLRRSRRRPVIAASTPPTGAGAPMRAARHAHAASRPAPEARVGPSAAAPRPA
ncbi:hypothetical protein GLE_3119 [Lysobacter enzymogenes]|uniref:Uncharacterized protein n=1 Tax=Lysobacter enzymogenes TaxID=69 RepID=A0A0S2DJ35_LYSEN|nr:hypothetical protein GLE_3119 [Lysobacter enzymogenes]